MCCYATVSWCLPWHCCPPKYEHYSSASCVAMPPFTRVSRVVCRIKRWCALLRGSSPTWCEVPRRPSRSWTRVSCLRSRNGSRSVAVCPRCRARLALTPPPQASTPTTDVLVEIAWALSFLSAREIETVQTLATQGFIPLIVRLLDDKSPQLAFPAVRVVGNMCGCGDAFSAAFLACPAFLTSMGSVLMNTTLRYGIQPVNTRWGCEHHSCSCSPLCACHHVGHNRKRSCGRCPTWLQDHRHTEPPSQLLASSSLHARC